MSTTGDLCLISVSSEQLPGMHRCWAASYMVPGGHFSGMYCPYTQRAYWSQLFSHFCTVPTKQNLHSPGKTQPLPISHAEKKPNTIRLLKNVVHVFTHEDISWKFSGKEFLQNTLSIHKDTISLYLKILLRTYLWWLVISLLKIKI